MQSKRDGLGLDTGRIPPTHLLAGFDQLLADSEPLKRVHVGAVALHCRGENTKASPPQRLELLCSIAHCYGERRRIKAETSSAAGIGETTLYTCAAAYLQTLRDWLEGWAPWLWGPCAVYVMLKWISLKKMGLTTSITRMIRKKKELVRTSDRLLDRSYAFEFTFLCVAFKLFIWIQNYFYPVLRVFIHFDFDGFAIFLLIYLPQNFNLI